MNFNFFCKRILLLIFTFSLFNCSKEAAVVKEVVVEEPDESDDEYEGLIREAKKYFDNPLPANAEIDANKLTNEKVALGKKLFLDVRLSKNNTISCASCHDLNKFGTDNLATSLGVAGRKGTRNSPTVFNAALHFTQFWDGRVGTVEEQAGMPILNHIEMAMDDEQSVVEKIQGIVEYKTFFKNAFPEEIEPVNFENITSAIAAFERTLLSPSRFDEFLKGDAKALTGKEKKGMFLFMTNRCVSCHDGPLVGGNKFRSFGSEENPYWVKTGSKNIDNGRYELTGEAVDRYVFKVPSLRNVTKTFPYFHDGSVADIEEAIRIMGEVQLNIDLEDDDIQAIKAFLNSLTGEVSI
ncbi:Cytochrome c peroxidase precursor [Tenacibaculum maritimum]|uniref:cytochrome-c peroxidase n=1 Tax=Tenacibaculum maritimum TaxID=107401 RepID=UPI0012E4F9EA|nr:cytochrome c peroxidase [Tenacibaculum maritimum]CAA0142452.1 Cytochrome c peroxidase precursor [Tenacibaculum maritimum]CAA0162342.1 Cytochrome c peroxidase precursor [Tenacibaculum maritimum]CAA0220528.1 Cytochrome c peroxidase precursor [Tenacibaculum maritimum]